MPSRIRPVVAFAVAVFAATMLHAASAPKPLKVLLVTGGCCHDYERQKDILKQGLEQRANVIVDFLHTPDKTTKPPLASLLNPKYAAGYDLVIHDECAAGIDEPDLVRHVLQPHVEGIPAVALHCAMHSFRVVKDFAQPQAPGSAGALWFDFLGLQSSRHGPKQPIAVHFVPGASPITNGLVDWTTGDEELYNNVQPPAVFAGHRSLATGHQKVKAKDGSSSIAEGVVVWTNVYGPKKVRVFGTTLGHTNETVGDGRYLDLLTRGLLWAAGKLREDGRPATGYDAPVRR